MILDGKTVGTVADGGVEEFAVEPGAHKLRIKLDWAGSSTVEFEVGMGETVTWVCRPNGGAWSALACVFTPGQYIALQPDPDA